MRSWILGLFVFVCSLQANEELALIMKNEDAYPRDEFIRLKKDFSNLFAEHLKKQNQDLSLLFKGSLEEIFQRFEAGLHNNLERWKEDLSSHLVLSMQPQAKAERNVAVNGTPSSKNADVPPPSVSSSSCALSPAYNAPAGSCLKDSWNVFSDVSFLYWRAVQEGMQTYTLYSSQSTTVTSTETIRDENYITGAIDFGYEPGFQVGFGVDLPYDNWQLYSEYTWYHHQFSDLFNFAGPNPHLTPGVSSHIYNLFPAFALKMNNFANYLLMPSTMLSSLDLHLNWVFLELARNYYVGKHFSLRPHFGLRVDRNTQQITQNFDLHQTSNLTTLAENANCGGVARQWANSWGLGPRTGVRVNYLFPYGLKIFGDVNASLLYSQFILKARQTSTISIPTDYQRQTSYMPPQTLKTLAPNLEMALGMGWGRSFHKDRWHMDLSMSYDFNAMWNQNVFHELVMQNVITENGDGSSARVLYRDLFLHGLTVKMGFEY